MIDQKVKTVADQEENIRSAMDEQTHGSSQILQAAGLVNDITRQVRAGSEEMLVGSRERLCKNSKFTQIFMKWHMKDDENRRS